MISPRVRVPKVKNESIDRERRGADNSHVGCAAYYSGPYQFQVLTHTSITMFYIVGLGLADEKDITIKGLEVIRYPKSVGSSSAPF